MIAAVVAGLAAFDLSFESAVAAQSILQAAFIVRFFTPLQAESAMLVHDLMRSTHAEGGERAVL